MCKPPWKASTASVYPSSYLVEYQRVGQVSSLPVHADAVWLAELLLGIGAQPELEHRHIGLTAATSQLLTWSFLKWSFDPSHRRFPGIQMLLETDKRIPDVGDVMDRTTT